MCSAGQAHVGQDLQLGSLYVSLTEFGTESFRSDRNNLYIFHWQAAFKLSGVSESEKNFIFVILKIFLYLDDHPGRDDLG